MLPPSFHPAARRWLPFLLLCLLLVPLKLHTLPSATGPFLIDASYYYQIARHVAEGDGLMTSVSLYHEGLDPLPAPATIYPLWPLVLGWSGRMVGILAAARILPTILFFLNLALLFLLAIRLAERFTPAADGGWGAAFTATLVTASFSSNFPFWFTTSEPYTEGLAFALAFGSLLALDEAQRRPSWRWGGVAGLLAGLAYLARSQMLLLAAATGLVLLASAPIVRRLRGAALAYWVAALIPAISWRIFLHLHPPQRQDIGQFETWVRSGSIAEYVRDRAPGLLVAFDPGSQLSYFNSFGPAVLVVPVALIWAVWEWRHGRRAPAAYAGWAIVTVAVLTGILNHVALLHRHAQFLLPWLFGWRHGLLFVFPFAVAATYLLVRAPRLLRGGTAILLVLSSIGGWVRIYAAPPVSRGLTEAQRGLVRWIDSNEVPPLILTTQAQYLGMLTRGRFHWISCDEPPSQTRRMLERLRITHVVLYDRDRPCQFASGLQDVLRVERWFGRPGEAILLLKRNEEPAALAPGESGRKE